MSDDKPKPKLPEPIVLPDLRDPEVYAALLKKAKWEMEESRRMRRNYAFRRFFMPWSS